MNSIFNMPTGAVDGITHYIGDLIADLGPFVWLAIGVPLGFYVIRKIISLIPKK